MDTWSFFSNTQNNKDKNTKPHPHSTRVHCWWGPVFKKTPRAAQLYKKFLLLSSTLHLARPPSSPRPGFSGRKILLPALIKMHPTLLLNPPLGKAS